MDYIFDTNIWIYILEGKEEVNDLKIKVKKGQVVPILTPVVFAEVLGWNELGDEQGKSVREYFSSLQMLSIQMEHWEQVITWRKLNRGKKLPDLLIGANSKISNIPIMTRNVDDFRRLEVSIENPWIDVK
jgi:predicted nucleic acid-binding protein